MNECPKCNGTGLSDSGGVQPWGEPVLIPCECLVEESIMESSNRQFLDWFEAEFGEVNVSPDLSDMVIKMIACQAWKASRAAMTPACWRTYYPDTDEESGRAHSQSGPESCAKRIASEIGGYVVPVYYGEPQQCAAGIKVKGE